MWARVAEGDVLAAQLGGWDSGEGNACMYIRYGYRHDTIWVL